MERSYQKKKIGFVAWILVLVLTINAKCDAFFLQSMLSTEAVTVDDNNINITTVTPDELSESPSVNFETAADTNTTDNYVNFNITDDKTLNTYQSTPALNTDGQEEATTQIVNLVKTIVDNVVNTANTTKSENGSNMPLVMSSSNSNERVSRIQHKELSFGLQILNETVNEEQVALPKTTLYSELKTDNGNTIEFMELPDKNHEEAGVALEKHIRSSVKDQIDLQVHDKIEPIRGVINDIPELLVRNVFAEDLDIEYSQISKAELFHKNDLNQESNVNLISAIENSSTIKTSAEKIINKPNSKSEKTYLKKEIKVSDKKVVPVNKHEEATDKKITYAHLISKSDRQMRALDKSVPKETDQIETESTATEVIIEKSTILAFKEDDVEMPKINSKSDSNSDSESSLSSSSQEDEIEKKEKESESVESFSDSESNESSSSSNVNSDTDKDPESVSDRDSDFDLNSNSNFNFSSNSNDSKSNDSITNILLRSMNPNQEEESASTTVINVFEEYTTEALMETATETNVSLVASTEELLNTTSVLLNENSPVIGDGHHHVYKKEKATTDQNFDLFENATDITTVNIVEPIVSTEKIVTVTEILIEEENKTETVATMTPLELVVETTTEFSTPTIEDQDYTTEYVVPVAKRIFPADADISVLQPSSNISSHSTEDITMHPIEWKDQVPQTEKTQLIERTTEEYLAVLPTQESILEHDLTKETEPLVNSTSSVIVSLTTTEIINKVQEHVSITSDSPMLNPNESTLTPNAVELITSTPGVENLVSKGSRSIDESLSSHKSSSFSEDYIEETSSGVSKALPTRRIEHNTASGRSLLLIALCLTIAVLFLGFVTTIFFMSIQRHRGTLDIEMQEQHCGIDQEDEETMHTLLTPSHTDSGED